MYVCICVCVCSVEGGSTHLCEKTSHLALTRLLLQVSYVSSTAPVMLLMVLLGAVCSADGSVRGLRAFLTPRWTQLARVQVMKTTGRKHLPSIIVPDC